MFGSVTISISRENPSNSCGPAVSTETGRSRANSAATAIVRLAWPRPWWWTKNAMGFLIDVTGRISSGVKGVGPQGGGDFGGTRMADDPDRGGVRVPGDQSGSLELTEPVGHAPAS